MPVTKIDAKPVGAGLPGPLTKRITEGYWKMHDWLFEQGGSFTDQSLPVALRQLGFEPQQFIRTMTSRQTLDNVRELGFDPNDIKYVFITESHEIHYGGAAQIKAETGATICMSAADSRRVYALIETGDGVPWHGQETESGELWRSDDGSETWEMVNYSRDLGGRTGYYNNCRVLPDDPDEAMFLTSQLTRPIDGARTGTALQGR